ncbi:MAG: RNA degradosome polyphosphate kinase [Lachnospiraceae bacterium]|nr:RNA degradosome polyphosphate kinase [Lachnospiraceae bacterium]
MNVLKNPEYYDNRELSWIKFNERVLEEAKKNSLPLLERLKFLSITASNLDEFFMVRVASLKDVENAGSTKKDITGMTAEEQLKQISKKLHEFIKSQYNTYNMSLVPQLEANGLKILKSYKDLTKEQAKETEKYFDEIVYPVLTPMAVDSSRPFPLVRNKSINIAALIASKEDKNEVDFATVQVPDVLPRGFFLEGEDGGQCLILLEEIIKQNMKKLFLNHDIRTMGVYRIIRNADLTIDEEEAADLLKEIEEKIRGRQWGQVIHLSVEDGMEKKLVKVLSDNFKVKKNDIYYLSGPADLKFFMKLYGLKGWDDKRNKPHKPAPVKEFMNGENIFDVIREKDVLMHHPYQSFDPVVNFVKQASVDPDVLAIKQTLYRVSGNSPIIAALEKAAHNGKQVTVLVELKARFDEEHNIVWAKKLEKAGCHVIYGLLGLKTHSKITLVVRREEEGIKRYVHLGTGNYNDSTAKLYTDMGLFTCDAAIGNDATAAFNMLSGYSEPESWNKLLVAPYWLKHAFYTMIDREIKHAKEGKEARIVAKMNSLNHKGIIQKLYEASQAGVKIDLIVRGICCLKVGIPGVSENITVRSIVGEFLEHARIFYFYNDGAEDIFLGSADWMNRNLERRVEIVFPIEDEQLKEEVKDVLRVQLADTLQARVYQPDGSYQKVDRRGKAALNSQEYFIKWANKQVKEEKVPVGQRKFTPLYEK